MSEVIINYVAVLTSGVVGMALGALWYSPLAFGKVWVKLSGMTEQKIEEAKKKGMAASYLITFVGTLLMAYVLAHVVEVAGATTIREGMQGGFWSWIGFVAPVTAGSVLWEGKSWKLWALNNAHYLLTLLLMGAILAVWS